MSKTLKFGLAAIALLCATAFFLKPLLNFNLEGPPEENFTRKEVNVENSTVHTSITVPTAFLEDTLNAAMLGKDPLIEGAIDKIAPDLIDAYLGLPRRETATCELTAQAKAAKRTVECFDKALKSGGLSVAVNTAKCFLSSSFDNITAARNTLGACVDKVSPVALPTINQSMNYTVSIENVTLQSGNGALRAKVLAKTRLTIPSSVRSVLKNAPQTICGPSVYASAVLTPDFSFNNKQVAQNEGHGQIVADLKVGKVSISPGPNCSNSKDLPQVIVDEMDKIILKTITDVFQTSARKALVKQANKTLNDTESPDSANAKLSLLLDELNNVIDLSPQLHSAAPAINGTELLLALNPQYVSVSDISLSKTHIKAGLGIAAKPVLSLQRNPSQEAYLELRKEPIQNNFSLMPRGQIDLGKAEESLTEIANQVIRETLPSLTFEHVELKLYQSGDRFVLGLNISGVTWLKLDGSLFLTARPTFDPETSTIGFEDVKFDIASKTFLLSKAAWVLESPIESLLSSRLKVSIEPQLKSVLATLSNVCLRIDLKAKEPKPILCEIAQNNSPQSKPAAQLEMSLKNLQLGDIWLSENNLNLTVSARGNSAIQILD